MKPPHRRILVRLLLASLALAAIVVFLVTRAPSAPAAEAREAAAARAVPVVVAPVERRDLPIWLDGLGSVAAWQQVTVRAQVDGRLEKVFFREGQTVHKGDLLARIDPRPFDVQLRQAQGSLARDRAQLEDNQINLDRYKTLVDKKLIAPQQLDDQRALVGQAGGAVQTDLAAVDSARLNLDYARITAPLDGVVGIRLVDPGNIVHAADTTGIVVIAQLDPAAVLFTLPEDDLPRIAAAHKQGGEVVEVWSRDGQTRLGTGTLTVVDNQINQTTATLRLKAAVGNPDGQLWPNQFVKARLLVDTQRDALVVPAAAVQRGPQGTFVYVAGADQKATARPLVVTLTTGELAIVGSGVTVGELVVVEGQSQLRPGTRVAPRPAGADLRAGAPP